MPETHREFDIEWLTDFEYSLVDDTGFRLGERLWDGPVLWEYDGQEVYTIAYTSWPGEITTIDRVPDREVFEDAILGVVKVDGNGSRWLAVELDRDLVDPTVLRAFDVGLAERVTGDDDEVERWTPFSWSIGTCPGTSTAFGIWNAESRNSFSSVPAARQRRVLMYQTVGQSACTGTLVEGSPWSTTKKMLTAAHCVVTPGLTTDPPAWICSQGNRYPGADCVQRNFTVVASSDWLAGNTSRRHDWAVVTWTEPSLGPDRSFLRGTPSTGMPIASQTNAQIESVSAGNYSHPGFTVPLPTVPVCSQTDNSSLAVENEYFNPMPTLSRRLFFEWTSNPNATSNYIRTKLDSTGGASGSPIINCLNGCNNTGGEEVVGMMVAGWFVGTQWRTGGPKWTRFGPTVGVL